MKIDLHMHAKERSGCSVSGEEEMIQAAIAEGLDGIAFTDHGRLVPAARLADLNARHAPFRIFGGIEMSVTEGEDVLVFGIRHPSLEAYRWSYPRLHEFVRELNGCLILAHPLRYRNELRVDVKANPPDAIEVHSLNIGACDEPEIRKIAAACGARLICASDAHFRGHVGAFHVVLDAAPENETALASLIRAGSYSCMRDDELVALFNEDVDRREEEIRKLIAEGRDALYYRETTGQWEGYFKRVAMGKSYRV